MSMCICACSSGCWTSRSSTGTNGSKSSCKSSSIIYGDDISEKKQLKNHRNMINIWINIQNMSLQRHILNLNRTSTETIHQKRSKALSGLDLLLHTRREFTSFLNHLVKQLANNFKPYFTFDSENVLLLFWQSWCRKKQSHIFFRICTQTTISCYYQDKSKLQ